MAKKILIIDDDKDLVQTMEQAFRANSYDVCTAYSGTEGLKKLLSEKPDLVILDIIMENDTTGFELAYQIRDKRKDSKYLGVKNTPIIILTAISQITKSRFSLNESQSFLPEIEEFLTKPVKIDELLVKVKKYL